MKHTPAPWVLDDDGRIHTEDGRAIARVVYEYLHYGEPARSEIQVEDDANAELIAAAPELYEAWVEYFNHRSRVFNAQIEGTLGKIPHEDLDAIFAKAKAAIAKAEGAQ